MNLAVASYRAHRYVVTWNQRRLQFTRSTTRVCVQLYIHTHTNRRSGPESEALRLYVICWWITLRFSYYLSLRFAKSRNWTFWCWFRFNTFINRHKNLLLHFFGVYLVFKKRYLASEVVWNNEMVEMLRVTLCSTFSCSKI